MFGKSDKQAVENSTDTQPKDSYDDVAKLVDQLSAADLVKIKVKAEIKLRDEWEARRATELDKVKAACKEFGFTATELKGYLVTRKRKSK